MQWEFIVALALAIPVILFPVAVIWYLNVGGIYQAIRRASRKRIARGKQTESVDNGPKEPGLEETPRNGARQ
jgi:hypothetical protein